MVCMHDLEAMNISMFLVVLFDKSRSIPLLRAVLEERSVSMLRGLIKRTEIGH